MKLALISEDIPLPSFHDIVGGVIQDPDQVIPIIIGRLGHPSNVATRFAAGTISLHLVALTVELKVVPLLYRSCARHRLRVVVFAHPNEHRGIVFREDGCDGGGVTETQLPSQCGGDEFAPEWGVHLRGQRRCDFEA